MLTRTMLTALLAGASLLLAVPALAAYHGGTAKAGTSGEGTKTARSYEEPVRTPDAVEIRRTSEGEVLTTTDGMPLYTFTADAARESECTGECARAWPPLKAAGDAEAPRGFSVIERDDGTRQWAFAGKPLYTFVKDEPGEVTGDGVESFGGTWRAAEV